MKYLLIVYATIFIGENQEPTKMTFEFPQESHQACIDASDDYKLDIPFPYLSLKVDTECRLGKQKKKTLCQFKVF